MKVAGIPATFFFANLKSITIFAVPFNGSGGGIGRHAGLKIPWAAMPVRVRFPSRAHIE